MWAAAFAVAHVYWAAGGRLGVPADAAPISTRPAFLAYDVASALIFVAAAVVATTLATDRIPTGQRGRVVTLVRWAALLALLRGFVGVAQAAIALVLGTLPGASSLYDVWFVVAGVVFVQAAALDTARTR